MLREIKDLIKYKDTPCSWIGRIDIKMTLLPKVVHRVNGISITIPKIEKHILKFIWNFKRPKYPKQFSQSWTTLIFNLQNLLQKYSNQNSVWYWNKDHMNQQKIYYVPYIWTFKLRTFKDANVHLHVQLCKLVHIWRTSSRVCILYKWLCFCVVYCIVLYRTGLPKWLGGKESTSQCRRHRKHGFDSWVRGI